MKLITRDTDYAVRALIFMAGSNNKIVSVQELVRELQIPRPFLRKILQTLNKRGKLKSYKGFGGGFLLALPPEKIFLADLIKIFQGTLKLNNCLFKKKVCPDKNTCPLRRRIGRIEENVISELGVISISSLAGKACLPAGSLSYGKKKNNKNR